MSQEELSFQSIKSCLSTRFIGQNIVFRPSVTSTMDLAHQEIKLGAPDGTVVIANIQTAGRGRLGRSWLSPEGSIDLSIIIYPQICYLSSIVMAATLAAADSIECVSGLKTDIKWPNDVLIHGKKVCGIMIESGPMLNSACYAVVGLGMNVNMHLADYAEIAAIATSLYDELGKEVSRLPLLRELLNRFEFWYEALLAGEPLIETWRKRLTTLGKSVLVRSGEAVFEGFAESVGPDGSLLLRQADGNLVTIPAGDVTLRP